MKFRRHPAIQFVVNLISLLVAIAWIAGAAFAQDVVDFRGKTITIIASFEAGGPYDFYSRLIARHIGAHLPGRSFTISPKVLLYLK